MAVHDGNDNAIKPRGPFYPSAFVEGFFMGNISHLLQ